MLFFVYASGWSILTILSQLRMAPTYRQRWHLKQERERTHDIAVAVIQAVRRGDQDILGIFRSCQSVVPAREPHSRATR